MSGLADRLLDAQVEWIVDQLTGEGLVDLLAADVDDFFAVGSQISLESVAGPTAVKLALRRILAADGDLLGDVLDLLTETIHGLPAARDHTLGSLVGRDHVERIVTKVLSMHDTQDRVMDTFQDSPAVGEVAARFVSKIVADFVQQNRETVEKLPGAKSLMSLGLGAANRVRKATSDTFIGDAAGRSTQYAIRRTNATAREVMRSPAFHRAALEIWDIQAERAVDQLHAYVAAADVREIVRLVHDLVVEAKGTPYAGELVDGCVDALYDVYGASDIATLVHGLGLGRDDLLFVLAQVAPPLLTTLRESGELDRIVRTRLAPFFESPAALAILDGAAPAKAPAKTAPAKKAAAKKAAPRPRKA